MTQEDIQNVSEPIFHAETEFGKNIRNNQKHLDLT